MFIKLFEIFRWEVLYTQSIITALRYHNNNGHFRNTKKRLVAEGQSLLLLTNVPIWNNSVEANLVIPDLHWCNGEQNWLITYEDLKKENQKLSFPLYG